MENLRASESIVRLSERRIGERIAVGKEMQRLERKGENDGCFAKVREDFVKRFEEKVEKEA